MTINAIGHDIGNNANVVQFTRDADPFRAFNAVDNAGAVAGNDILAQTPGLVEQLRALGQKESGFGLRQDITAARERAASASDVDFGTFQRKTAGLDLSDRQKRAAETRHGLARTIAQASASGQLQRQRIDDAKTVRRVSGGLSDILFGQRSGQAIDDAAAQAARQSGEANRKAAKKEATASTIGTVVGAAIAMFSSEDYKDDHGSEHRLLDKLKNVRVNRWNYKGQDRQHIGPFSEEFNEAFELNADRPDMISVIDALGVTLGSVKELNEKVDKLNGV
jgi:hypothetical protein